MSKCWICGKEMKHTVGGCEHCPDCGVGINDLVFRRGLTNEMGNFYEQGWVCPKCGAVMSPRQLYCLNCSKTINKTTITCCEREDLSNPY